jgi:hypothetical protein
MDTLRRHNNVIPSCGIVVSFIGVEADFAFCDEEGFVVHAVPVEDGLERHRLVSLVEDRRERERWKGRKVEGKRGRGEKTNTLSFRTNFQHNRPNAIICVAAILKDANFNRTHLDEFS